MDLIILNCCSSLFSCQVMSDSLQPPGLQHTRLPHPSLSPWVCSNSCPLNWWCHPTILSSVVPFSCLQSFPASGSFLISRLFTPGDQRIRASASASVLPMNIQGWFPLGLTGLISMLSKALSRVFSNTTVWRPSILQPSAFFIVPPSLGTPGLLINLPRNWLSQYQVKLVEQGCPNCETVLRVSKSE